MQSVRSRIWTRVALSISYDDNDYTTGTMGTSLVWYYACHSTECEESNTVVPFRISIDITSSNTRQLRCSRSKVFIVQTAYGFLAIIEAQENERERERERGGGEKELVKVYEQRHTCRYNKVTHPLSLPRRALWISTLFQLANQTQPTISQLTYFQNSLISIYSKIKYIIGVTTSHQIIASYRCDHHTCP